MSLTQVSLGVFGSLAAVLLLVAGGRKIAGQQAMRDAAGHFSIPWPRYQAIGWLELLAVAGIVTGFWVAGIGLAAGLGVLLLMAGALVFHARLRDPLPAMVPALLALIFAGGYVATQTAAVW